MIEPAACPDGSRGQIESDAAMTLAIEIIGWFGAALILVAYLLLSTGRLGADSSGDNQCSLSPKKREAQPRRRPRRRLASGGASSRC